jgi:trigger factor
MLGDESSMQSQVSEISPVLVEVKVEVPWDRVQKDLQSTYTKLARTARVRGFRPGKVPLNVVKQLFKKQVQAEVAGSLIEQGLMSAVEQHDIAIVAQPELSDAAEIKDGSPFEFRARIEVRPQIERVVFEGLEVFRDLDEVTDAQVDERIAQLREQNADVQEPDPMRPAQKGDQLVIDYEVTVDGEPKPDMAASARPVELGSGRLLEQFEAGLLGTQPGESKDITVTFSDDASAEELRGKTAVFKVQVKELREKVLPELDDEFAKDVGDYEGLDALRVQLRKDLEEEAKRRSESSIKDQIVSALVEKNEVPVPPSLVQQQKQQMTRELITLMQITGQQPGALGELLSGMEQRAERRVKAGILLGALARQEKIEVSEADVEAKLAEIAESSGKHIAKVRVDYQGERRESLEGQLLESKLMAMLMERVNLKDGHPPATEPSTEGSEQG